MSKKKQFFIVLSLVLQVLMVRILSYYPEVIEVWYSNRFFPIVSNLYRAVLGWIPFSVGDIFIGFGILLSIRWIIKNFKFKLQSFKSFCFNVLKTMGVFYFLFHLLWGFNYYRLPLHKKLGLDSNYTTKSLIEVTEDLIFATNKVHLSLVENTNTAFNLNYDFRVLSNKIYDGFTEVSASYSFLKYNIKSHKQSLFSWPQAYMGFSGYLNPFTLEAQINAYTPKNSMPLTLAHETAHQLGYAAENEANFIAFLATENHSDSKIRYSALTFALRYCLNELYKRDDKEFQRLKIKINSGILQDFKNRQNQWLRFKSPLESYFKSSYSVYLKANQQQKGIESYNHVVALLVNYLEQTPLIE